jgi:hypothetical protein
MVIAIVFCHDLFSYKRKVQKKNETSLRLGSCNVTITMNTIPGIPHLSRLL